MLKWLAALFAALIAPAAQPQDRQQAVPIDPRPGVTTHFSQGWPLRLIDNAAALGTGTVRDSLHWAAVETTPGAYLFTDKNSGHVGRICSAGMEVLLVIEPRNKLYDSGYSAYTPEAQQAFARYLAAIAARYPGCVIGIEVGNEINGRGNVTGPAATNRVAWYMSLIKAVHGQLRPAYPQVAIVGGSTNTIATGFLERLFAAGMLNYVDAVAVHPYRNRPEGVDWELERLDAAMRRHGPVRPVWATEFSRDFIDPAQGATFYLKMIALQQSRQVQRHFWYALIDQKWFPTMGLLKLDGTVKPAAKAYLFAARLLGPAVRIDHGDPGLFHIRMGPGIDLVWGAPRALMVTGTAQFRSAEGSAIAQPGQLSNEPVVIEGASTIAFGPPQVLADSLYDFGGERLAWFARREATGTELPLTPIDWQWTTYLGNADARQMVVTQDGIGPANNTAAVVRYTSDVARQLHLSVCLQPTGTSGDGTMASLLRNGQPLWSAAAGPLTGRRQASIDLSAKAGDRIELVVAPGASALGDRMKYRLIFAAVPQPPAECPG